MATILAEGYDKFRHAALDWPIFDRLPWSAVTERSTPEPAAERRWAIGVDIGGTKTLAVALSSHVRQATARAKRPTDITSTDTILAGAVEAIDDVMRRLGTDWTGIASIGVGVPGVDHEHGSMRFAGNWASAVGRSRSARSGSGVGPIRTKRSSSRGRP